MRIKAVGFDLDDTLYDRNDVYRKVFKIMQNDVMRLDVDFDTFNKVYQRISNEEFFKFNKGLKSQEQYRIDRTVLTYDYFGYNMTPAEAMVYYLLYKRYRNEITIRPYMEKAMDYLINKGIEVFVITNGSEDIQVDKLKRLGVLDRIKLDKCFISESIGEAKPSEAVFKHVESSLGLTGEEIMYIGDHLENDIEGSLVHNWKAVYYNVNDCFDYDHAQCVTFFEDEAVYHYMKDLFN